MIWVLGKYFGDGNPFRFDWFEHTEWSVVGFFIWMGILILPRLVYGPNGPYKLWTRTAGVIIGACLGGIVMDMLYYFVTPHFGITMGMHLVYFDIRLPTYVTSSVSFTIWGLMISVPVTIHHSNKYKHQLELVIRELEKDKLEQSKNKAVLEALRAKINPHFLYNALNSIASLVKQDPGKAEDMIVSLSDLFRHSIDPSNDHFSTVEKEVEMAGIYLNIEKIRFGDHLNYNLSVEEDCKRIRLPKFLLQPLVENAVIHGISKVSNGQIEVKVYSKGEQMIVEVHDNGPPFVNDLISGHGISIITEKLQLLYGEDFSFSMISEGRKHVKVSLKKESHE